jgi:hypothetical protein
VIYKGVKERECVREFIRDSFGSEREYIDNGIP